MHNHRIFWHKLKLLGLPLLLLLSACSTSEELSDDERELLLSAKDFAQVSIREGGQYSKNVNYLMGTVEITHTSFQDPSLSLYSSLYIYPNSGSAILNAGAEEFGATLAFDNDEIIKQPLALSTKQTNDSKLYVLRKDGTAVGNMFVSRIENKNLFVLFIGLHFERADEFEDFIEPSLKRIRAFEGQNPLLQWLSGT